jgi:hypothetical protein
MAVYGPVRHQKNIIWTEASVHIIFFYCHMTRSEMNYIVFAILHLLSKIIMQVPFQNRIENEAVQSRSI